MRVHGIPAMRFLAILACISITVIIVCGRLVVEPSCQLERERAFRAEQMVLRLQAQIPENGNDQAQQRIAQLERALQDERAKNSGSGGFQGAMVDSLKVENQKLQSQNADLRSQLDRLSRGEGSPQNSLLRAGRLGDQLGYVAQPRSEPITEDKLRELASQGATAVAVITCKRPRYLERAMANFVMQRGTSQATKFPFIISQDAYDFGMTTLVQSKYVAEGLAYHMHHEHDPNAPQIATRFGKNSVGYVRIAQHYGYVLRRIFEEFGFGQVIFLEEDMEVAPDFFSYFSAMLPILKADSMMFCVSAWNDNGYDKLVSDPRAVYRTEFFPGLGWMMDRRFWDEVRDRWAVAFWDEFMRRPDVRRGRHCIRPEISRSFTFGEDGVSKGQFFKTHLSKIKLNDVPVDWAAEDLSYLQTPEAWEAHLTQQLKQATAVSFEEVDMNAQSGGALRIQYDDKRDFKRVAAKFSLMPDEKEGVRRGAYRGVIPFSWVGTRVYLFTANWPESLY